MLRTVFLFLCLICLHSPGLYAQKKWKDVYYTELSDENFRDLKAFNKSVNLKNPDYKILNAAIFFVSNEARLEQGLKPVQYHANLEVMAWNHSMRMGKDDFFDHIHPKNKKRRKPENRAALAGIKNPYISENITAIGGLKFGSYLELADALVDSWIDSPPHRATLYSKDALELGCGAYYYNGVWQKNKDIKKQGNGFWLATQNFQLFTKVEAKSSKEKKPK